MEGEGYVKIDNLSSTSPYLITFLEIGYQEGFSVHVINHGLMKTKVPVYQDCRGQMRWVIAPESY